MPANLTPMYHKAEREFRRAVTPHERLACLEQMLTLLPKHKGTDKLQADIKRRIKEARGDVAVQQSKTGAGSSVRIPRQGCAQVVVIGAPNSGKSQLIAALTNGRPEVAPYPYTTRLASPAMMDFEDVQVQLVDTPPIAENACDPSTLNLIRGADLVVLTIDGSDDDAIDATITVIHELERRNTRLMSRSHFIDDGLTKLAVRGMAVVTRGLADDVTVRLELLASERNLEMPVVRVDCCDPRDQARLKQVLFESLDVIRVYTKRPGKPIDRHDPYTLPKESTVEDVAAKVHEDFVRRLTHARVWNRLGDGGQAVGRDHPLRDGDVVELSTT